MLFRSLNTRATLRDFFAEFGVDKERFDRAYRSDETTARLRLAQSLPRHWGVTGTPSVVINGRYLLSGSIAGGYSALVSVGRRLIRQELSPNPAETAR